MTKQDIFDTVVHHLFKQGKKARGCDHLCSYRGDDKTSCAVGCLVPDNLYTEKMEGRGVIHLFCMEDFKAIADHLGEDNKQLLYSLQRVHDNCAEDENGAFDKADLKERLFVATQTHSLSAKVLESY
jgi:hypothetical protein